MIKIRLSRTGRKNKHSYRIVVACTKFSRNGRFIEKLGFFNIFNKNNIFNLNNNRFIFWKNNGAKISDRVKFLIKKYYFKKN